MIAQLRGKIIAKRLNRLDKEYKDNHRKQHQRKIQALIAVSQRQIAYPAGSDGARHGCGSDQSNRSGRNRQNQRTSSLRQ